MKRTVIAVGLILLSVTGLSGCGRDRQLVEFTTDESNLEILHSAAFDAETTSPDGTDSSEDTTTNLPRLTALVDTLEEAQEIADLYGIELDSYSYGVASYHSDKDISELITLGEENNYPTLTPSTKSYLHTEQ